LESAQVLMHGAPRDAERLGELVGAPALLPFEERRQQRPLPRTQRFDRRDVHAADYPPCWAISNFVNFFLYKVEPSAPVPALMTWRSVRRSNPSPAWRDPPWPKPSESAAAPRSSSSPRASPLPPPNPS